MRSSNIRSPDVSFTRKERFPGGVPPEGFADFAPDLCIDIISPSEDRDDMERKRRDYFAAGARQVWHLFPQAQRVLVYTSPAASVAYEADDDVDAGDLLRGFRCRAAELFALE